MHTIVGDVEKGQLTIVKGGGHLTGKTKNLTKAAMELAAEGWKVWYVTCDEHPVTISKRIADDHKYDSIKIVQGNLKPGFISEVIKACKFDTPDVLIIDGYRLGTNDLRLLQEAARDLKMGVLPTQPKPRDSILK